MDPVKICYAIEKFISTHGNGLFIFCLIVFVSGLVAKSKENKTIKPSEETDKKSIIGEEVTVEQIQNELNKTKSKKKSILKNIGILAISVILFISFGLFNNSISGILIIAGVLFIHEFGHFVGMKLFRYKDVQMFFIPLFGAAVSGVETNTSGTKKAIVALLGPLPGILLGIICGVMYVVTLEDMFATAARTFIFLNVFNMLPLYPLDGGRFFDDILLSRSPKIEVTFKALAAIALIFIAFLFKSVLLGLLAFFILVSLPQTYSIAVIAKKLKKEIRSEEKSSLGTIPENALSLIAVSLNEKIPAAQRKSDLFAIYAKDIWRKVCDKPASVKASIALILFYVVFVLIGLIAYLGFEAVMVLAKPKTEVVQQMDTDGHSVWVENQYILGKKESEVQLNNDGLYSGRFISWDTSTGNKVLEGHCKDGYKNGEWKRWDAKGNLTEIEEYNMGYPVHYSTVISGNATELPRGKWPFYAKRVQKKPKKAEKFKITNTAK